MSLYRLFPIITLLLASAGAMAQLSEGKKSIHLKTNAGDALTIGTVSLKKSGDSLSFSLEMDDSQFSDQFLSMRPFKCLNGPNHMLCHLVYPYKKETVISNNELISLEYDLLFIHRQKSDYGIDPWNGIYYKLAVNDDGSMTGTLTEVDLNILAAPPEKGVTWPIGKSDLHEAEALSHSYPLVEIK